MYSYKLGEGVDHPLFLFTSSYNLIFNVRFESIENQFEGMQSLMSISIGCEDNVKPPFDYQVGETVCYIIEEYLSNNKKVILSYVCDNLDGRGAIRQKKFSRWHSRFGNGTYVAIPHTITTNDGSIIYTCLIFDAANYEETLVLQSYKSAIDDLCDK